MARKRLTLHPAIERAVLTWVAQKRMILEGDGGQASYNVIERIRRERDGAGQGKKQVQRWAEVYWGDGLRVQQVVIELPEMPRMVFTCYYLLARDWYVPVTDQSIGIGITKTEYWEYLGKGETGVETALKVLRSTGQELIGMDAETVYERS